jgi:hypothetical protein
LEAEHDRMCKFSSEACFFFDLDRIELLKTLLNMPLMPPDGGTASGTKPATGIIDILARHTARSPV